MPQNCERISDDAVHGPTIGLIEVKAVTERLTVPGGFLYRTIAATTAELEDRKSVSVGMAFVPGR